MSAKTYKIMVKQPVVILKLLFLLPLVTTYSLTGQNETLEVLPGTPRRSTQSVAAFRSQAYAVQNCYRRLHGAPPCDPSSDLEQQSQNYANQLAETNSFKHSGARGVGECLYKSVGNVNGASAINAWYDEVRYYDYSNPGFASKTGHFTQLVWKASTSCGISFAEGSDGWTVVVENFRPSGNVEGRYAQNVGAPQGSGSASDCASLTGGGGGGSPAPSPAPAPPPQQPSPAPGPPQQPAPSPSRPPPSGPPGPPSRPPPSSNDCYYGNDGYIYCPSSDYSRYYTEPQDNSL